MTERGGALPADDDAMRHTWQQMEDSSRRKELRARMSRLRELHAPEHETHAKGYEFTSTQGHGRSFADQTFQSMKSKEVRDAASPTKEFTYRGQDLKELSNAGWDVESENTTTDDGHTRVRSVQANIEGKYDVKGGTGQFAAIDQHKSTVTVYSDDNTSLLRNQSSSNSAAHEQILRQSNDGTQFVTSEEHHSSTSSCKFEQMSTTKQDSVPHSMKEKFIDNSSYNEHDTKTSYLSNSNNHEEISKRNEYEQAKLVSKKVEYPDENTKIVVETRCLPDGTTVTSTRREFRPPIVQNSHIEQHSSQNSVLKLSQDTNNSKGNDRSILDNVMDRQKISDEKCFKTQTYDAEKYTSDHELNKKMYIDNDKISFFDSQQHMANKSSENRFTENVTKNVTKTGNLVATQDREINQNQDTANFIIKNTTVTEIIRGTDDIKENNISRSHDIKTLHEHKPNETLSLQNQNLSNVRSKTLNEQGDKLAHIAVSEGTSENKPTHQTEYPSKKLSNDWSPSHQAWASTLRADTPSTIRPSTRASSPGSKTFKSSNSSLRSSVSPDKGNKRPSSRGVSPIKSNRESPTRSSSHQINTKSETSHFKFTNQEKTCLDSSSSTKFYSSPNRQSSNRESLSPDKKIQNNASKFSHHDDIESKIDTKDSVFTSAKKIERAEKIDIKQIFDNETSNNSGQVTERTICESRQQNKYTNENVIHDNVTLSPEKINAGSKQSVEKDSVRYNVNNRQSPDKIILKQKTPISKDKTTDKIISERTALNPEKESSPHRTHSPISLGKSLRSEMVNENLSTQSTRDIQDKSDFSKSSTPVTEKPQSTDACKNNVKPVRSGHRHGKSLSPEKTYDIAPKKSSSPNDVSRYTKESNNLSSNTSPIRELHSPEKVSIKGENLKPQYNKQHGSFNKVKLEHQKFVDEEGIKTKFSSSPDKQLETVRRSQSPVRMPIGIASMTELNSDSIICKDTLLSHEKHLKKSSLDNYQQVDQFINTERNAQESINNSVDVRNRKLVTPSSSPTRMPKTADKVPSIGEKSSTTSSGFLYFNSPERQITNDCNESSDLKELTLTENTGNTIETSDKKFSQLSRIPCRSPSPEKRVSQLNESLPRKSSLKKTSHYISAIEKSTSYLPITPDTDINLPKNDKHQDISRPKPPLERRETYEERCRKILGMIDDSKVLITDDPSSNMTENVLQGKSTENSKLRFFDDTTVNEKLKPKNSIEQIKEKSSKHTAIRNEVKSGKRSISRETSPTKLQDIILNPTDNLKNDISTTIHNELQKEKYDSCINTPPSSSTRRSPDKHFVSDSEKLPTRSGDLCDSVSNLNATPEFTFAAPQIANKTSDTISEEVLFDDSQTTRSRTPSPTKNQYRKHDVSNSKIIHIKQTLANSDPHPTPSSVKQITKEPDYKYHRTPSPVKETITDEKLTQNTSIRTNVCETLEFEKEQQRTQNSLPKLSPTQKNPQLDQLCKENIDSVNESNKKSISESFSKADIKNNKEMLTKKPTPLKENVESKLPPRSTSPLKKHATPSKSTNSPRSTSPRKATSPTEKTEPPKTLKLNESKSKEKQSNLLIKTTSPTKAEKSINSNKITGKPITVSKQINSSKIITQINKIQQPPSKHLVQDTNRRTIATNYYTKIDASNDLVSKATRTPSEPLTRLGKPIQKLKPKPEYQASNVKINRSINNTVTKVPKLKPHECQFNLIDKPIPSSVKLTDNDVTVDIQLAKSSRESSPDRICPTPVNILDDVGTPRLPDEVSEPDDECGGRSHHTIHETETIVDDIVEINEDEELFVNMAEMKIIPESYKHKANFNKEPTMKFNSQTSQKSTASTDHSKGSTPKTDSYSIQDNLKSDECLLTVSEKVNKFAKCQLSVNIEKIPSRNVIEEPDNETKYQDVYTKLSVNDEAHLFIETAEKSKLNVRKTKKFNELVDVTGVDNGLKLDDCVVSVSDKVNKFVKTSKGKGNEYNEICEKDKTVKGNDTNTTTNILQESIRGGTKSNLKYSENNCQVNEQISEEHKKVGAFAKDTASSQAKSRNCSSPNLKITECVKITTLRSSEAIKKAKEIFEKGSSTNCRDEKRAAKLTDIGVGTKSPKNNEMFNSREIISDVNLEKQDLPKSKTPQDDILTKNLHQKYLPVNQDDKIYSTEASSKKFRMQSPALQTTQINSSGDSKINRKTEKKTEEKHLAYVPSYQNLMKNNELKEDTKTIENFDVSSRRGSGKFGVELRRTSTERSTLSSEGRRSVDHHQPCIEDIFELDLLEQMLEKVVGYEQRRRIRSQIRTVKKKMEGDLSTNTNSFAKETNKNITLLKSKFPERRFQPAIDQKTRSPERHRGEKINNIVSSDHSHLKKNYNTGKHDKTNTSHKASTPNKTNSDLNNETADFINQSKTGKKSTSPSRSITIKKNNRFNEYASAYMKKVGINDNHSLGLNKNIKEQKDAKQIEKYSVEMESKIKSVVEKHEDTKSINNTNVRQINGKRSPSPTKKSSPERKTESPNEKFLQRSPSPTTKHQKIAITKKEPNIKNTCGIENKLHTEKFNETEKPSWVTQRNLKKVTSETRTFSSKRMEPEKYRAPSPSKIISKPLDVITSSYGPGPLDADGRPLFGIRALRNGAANCQVKGTVIRQEFRSRNGGEPEGSVSVTAYCSQPGDVAPLLRGPAAVTAITTTRAFGGDSGATLQEVFSKEEQAALERFTASEQRGPAATPAPPPGGYGEKKTVRQSSVKSLTEKYIKSTGGARANTGSGAGRSFLDNSTKVAGVQDILARMRNADAEGAVEACGGGAEAQEEAEARALLNKFLGASVLMAGMRGHLEAHPQLEQCVEQERQERRGLRALRATMADPACAESAAAATAIAAVEGEGTGVEADAREEETVTTVTSSVRRSSSEQTTTTTTTTETTKARGSPGAPARPRPPAAAAPATPET